jgi:hypothetical protein
MALAWAISVVTYAGLLTLLVGGLSVLRPLRLLRVPSRAAGLRLALAGVFLIPTGAWWPWPVHHAAGRTRLDAFVPDYQFVEVHEARVHAPAEVVSRAIHAVTADEIRLFRTLTWIRSPRWREDASSQSILRPDWHAPILDVATRTGFVWLADTPEEMVVGTVVCCHGARVQTAGDLARPGVAWAAMNFRVADLGDGTCRVATETRVVASDVATRRRFGAYWALIFPGSSLIREGWLEAIRRRAEAPAAATDRTAPPPAAPTR